jgi:hypothetical protein
VKTADKIPIKRAVLLETETAKTQNFQSQFYIQDPEPSSANLKLQLGEFLFLLQTTLRPHERKVCWQVFETKLNEYIDLKNARMQR